MSRSSTVATLLKERPWHREQSFDAHDLDTITVSNGPSRPVKRSHTDELISSQMAGRLNSASVSDDEVEELLAKRRALIEKKYTEGLTVVEAYKLEFYRWSLDRIDHARHGLSIESLERKAAAFKELAGEIEKLRQELEASRMSP